MAQGLQSGSLRPTVGVMARLPLFPLGAVLLPGGSLPLRVFEPRYVDLLRDVLASEERHFGVVAIKRGNEVGGTRPELYPVGCATRIEHVRRVEGGAFALATRGTRRFALDDVVVDAAPYLMGEVTWLDVEPQTTRMGATVTGSDTRTHAAIRQVQRLARTYATALGAPVDLAGDPAAVASTAIDLIGLSVPERQQVLQAGDDAARLRHVGRLLGREIALVQALGRIGPYRLDRVVPN